MPENQETILTKTNNEVRPGLDTTRRLVNGGRLYIVDQAHRKDYPQDTIEKDIITLDPDIVIPENIYPFGPGLLPEEIFNIPDIQHQLSLIKSLRGGRVPVILADNSSGGTFDRQDLNMGTLNNLYLKHLILTCLLYNPQPYYQCQL